MKKCVLVMVGCVVALGVTAYGSLINPGFDGDGSAPSGDGWTFYGQYPGLDSVTTRSGPGSATMYAADCNYAGVCQSLPASAGELWQATVWSRTNSNDTIKGKAIKGGMNIEFYDAGGSRIDYLVTYILDGSNANLPEGTWVEGSAQMVAPAGTARVLLALYVERTDPNAWGSIRYDDASLTVIPEPMTLTLMGLPLLGFLRRR